MNIELLLVQRRIRLGDNRLLHQFFHFVQQPRIIRLERLRDFGIDSQHNVAVFQLLGDLPHFDIDFVANGIHRFHVPGRLAIWTRSSNRPLQ